MGMGRLIDRLEVEIRNSALRLVVISIFLGFGFDLAWLFHPACLGGKVLQGSLNQRVVESLLHGEAWPVQVTKWKSIPEVTGNTIGLGKEMMASEEVEVVLNTLQVRLKGNW
jgi:hypothetical protein